MSSKDKLTLEQVRRFVGADPFKPFELQLESGERLRVNRYYELGIFDDAGRRLVGTSPRNGFVFFAIDAIVNWRWLPRGGRANGAKKRGGRR